MERAARDENLEFLKITVDAGASKYSIQLALASAAAGNAIVFLVEHGANADGFGESLEPRNEADRPSFEELQTPLVISASYR